MLRLLNYVLLAVTFIAIACSKKNNSSNEADLYGSWAKGANVGDTLIFKNENGRNLLQFNATLNPATPVYTKVEYNYSNNKLFVNLGGNTQTQLSSFVWKQPNQQFDILGFQLFLFMSSSSTHFTYTKVN